MQDDEKGKGKEKIRDLASAYRKKKGKATILPNPLLGLSEQSVPAKQEAPVAEAPKDKKPFSSLMQDTIDSWADIKKQGYRPLELAEEPKKKSLEELFAEIQQARADRERLIAETAPETVAFNARGGGGRRFAVSPSMGEDRDKWRMTHFDDKGPVGHVEGLTFPQALETAHEYGADLKNRLPTDAFAEGGSVQPITGVTFDNSAEAEERLKQKLAMWAKQYEESQKPQTVFPKAYDPEGTARPEEKRGEHLVHYSQSGKVFPKLDPKFFGEGRAGQERERGNIIPRTYYYEAESSPEAVVRSGAKHRYVVPRPDRILDLASDEGAHWVRRAGGDMSELEQMLKDHGFAGYKNSAHPELPHAVALFHEQEPIHITPKFAEGGRVMMQEGGDPGMMEGLSPYEQQILKGMQGQPMPEQIAPTPSIAPQMPEQPAQMAPETLSPYEQEILGRVNAPEADLSVPKPSAEVTLPGQEKPLATTFTREYAPVWDISGPEPKLTTIPHEQVMPGILEGRYSFDKGAMVPMKFADGEVISVPASKIDQALGHQMTYATPDDIGKFKYGSASQQALGTVESIAQGFLGPVAPMLETATGLTTAEAIRGRREVSPEWHGAVETAAFTLPLVATLGEWGAARAGLSGIAKGIGAVGKATEYTLPGVINKLGAAVVPIKETTTFLPFVGLSAMRGAFENVLGQSSTELTKEFLNYPDHTAETAASAIGAAALFGFGLGGGLGVFFGAAPFVTTKAMPWAKSKLGKLLGRAEEAEEMMLPPEPPRPKTEMEIQEEMEFQQMERDQEELQKQFNLFEEGKTPGVPPEEPTPTTVPSAEPVETAPVVETDPDTPPNITPESHPDQGVVVPKAEAEAIKDGNTEAVIKNSPEFTENEKQTFLSALKRPKKDISKIMQAWERVVKQRFPKAQPPVGLTHAERRVQELEQAASKSMFLGGNAIQKNINHVFDSINDEIVRIVGAPQPVSAIETGEQISEAITRGLNIIERYNQMAYNLVRNVQREVPLSPSAKQALIDEASARLANLKIADPKVKAQLKFFIENLKLKTNLDDLKKLKTQLGNRAKTAELDRNAKSFLYELQNITRKGESDVMDAFISESAGVSPELAHQYLRVKAARAEADARFSKYSSKYERLFDALGLEQAITFTDYGRILSELSPEELVVAIKNASYADKQWIKENFRGQFDMFKKWYIHKNLLKHNVKPEDIKPTKLFNAFKDFKEMELYFTPEEIKRLQEAEYLFRSMPENFNPSGSGDRINMHNFLREMMNPFGWHAIAAKEAAFQAGMKAMTMSEAELQKAVEKGKGKKYAEGGMVTAEESPLRMLSGAGQNNNFNPPANIATPSVTPMSFQSYITAPPQIQSSVKMAQTIIKGDQLVKNSVKSLFDPKSTYKVPAPSEKNIKALRGYVSKIRDNPEVLLDMTNAVHPAVPEFATPFSQIAVRAANYLNSVEPKQQIPGALDMDIPGPRGVHDDMYNHVIRIVEQPMYIMNRIKTGTMIPEEVDAFRTVYPKLYDTVSQRITEHMVDAKAKGTTIPYRTKLGLSAFLGSPLDTTMSPESIQSAQPQGQNQPPQGAQTGAQPKRSTSALDKMATMAQTPGQARMGEKSKGK